MKSIDALYERIGEYPWRDKADLADFDALVDAVRDEMREMKSEELTCAFCGKPRSEVEYLVQSATGQCICNDCVLDATRLIMQSQFKRSGGNAASREVKVPENKLVYHMANMSGRPYAHIAYEMGKSKSYISQSVRSGSSPTAASLSKLAKACDYRLILEGHGESITIVDKD